MFDETIRQLRRLGRGVRLSIALPLDDAGYLDRKCPSPKCGVGFKVRGDDWFSEKVRDNEAFCPFCRHSAAANAWSTPEQVEHIRSTGLAHVNRQLGDALSADARRQNVRNRNRPRGGLIDVSMTMEYKPGPRPVVLPLRAAELLRQEFACEACHCRWSSFGASFFCPGCGRNCVDAMFDRTLDVVRGTIEALPKVQEALAESISREMAADAARQVVEDQFSRLVGAFERLSEALFDRLPNAGQQDRARNVFQRVDDGSALWRAGAGGGYEVHLNDAELRALRLRFQQRHVLGHRQGIIDQLYLDRSGDRSYVVGQRLVVRGGDVLELADNLQKLAAGLRRVVRGAGGHVDQT